MTYTIKYIEPHGEKEIEAQLDVADTNMDDLPLLLTKFAEDICGTSVKVTRVIADDEFEESTDDTVGSAANSLVEDGPYDGYPGFESGDGTTNWSTYFSQEELDTPQPVNLKPFMDPEHGFCPSCRHGVNKENSPVRCRFCNQKLIW